MTKIALIIFHANITQYPKEWTDLCLDTIRKQTYKKFTVYEIDYGGTKNQIYKGSKFFNRKFPTHAHAHNFLCRKAVKDGFDCVFNTNVDDFYYHQRIELQLPYIEKGYDVVSCNHTMVNSENEYSTPGALVYVQRNKPIELLTDYPFSNFDIELEAAKGRNIISHPGCVYSKNFIENSGLLVPSEIPKDDFNLWKRSYKKFKFVIVPMTLLCYRVHENNISKK